MTNPEPAQDKPVPEVRQCQDQTSFQFGSTAVKASDDRWGVMSPANGGHWAKDAEVKDWAQLATLIVDPPAPVLGS